MAAGVGALGVNRAGQQSNDRVDQLLLPLHQLGALHAHRRQGGQGLDQALIERMERTCEAKGRIGAQNRIRRVLAIDQLQHTHDLATTGAQRHGEHRHRAVAELPIDRAVEAVGERRIELIGIGDVEHLAAEGAPAHQPLGRDRKADVIHLLFDRIDAAVIGAGIKAGVLRHRKPETIRRRLVACGGFRHAEALRLRFLHQEDAAGISGGERPGPAQDAMQQAAQIASLADGRGDAKDFQ